MKLHIVDTGLFKLDGGAMFGVVPKQMWNKLNPADENNMCTWAMRCLLVETDHRLILVDTGMGDKQDDKFKSHYGALGRSTLTTSISSLGFSIDDITDVFITHMHFDHVGGAVSYNSHGELVPTFSNATYWTSSSHYEWAHNPNDREKASFLKENFVPLLDHGVLKFIDEIQDTIWLEGIQVKFFYGHTHSMMVPIIPLSNGGSLVYCADLLPSSYHVRMPYIMAYDIRPLKTLAEKKAFYNVAIEKDYYLYFEHDPINILGKLETTVKGKYRIQDIPFEEVSS